MIKAIDTSYGGKLFRSRLDARLPDNILKKILKISSDSYILGSNDCYRITKDHFELKNKL